MKCKNYKLPYRLVTGSRSWVHDKIFTGQQKTEIYLDNLSRFFEKQDEFNLKDCSVVWD